MGTLPSRTLTTGATDFIDEAKLDALLRQPEPDASKVRDIISKSLEKHPLQVEETATLLACRNQEVWEEVFETARELKRRVYGNRIVLFAPLYVGNHCINNCGYCAFRTSNHDAQRVTLSPEELINQVKSLEQVGHKRLILVFGEHPDYDASFIAQTVRSVYGVKLGHGEIRRVNINAAPLDIEGYKQVKDAGIGTYQIFMETYHHETYRRYHPPHTSKGDYMYRLDGLSRAMEAGCDDVGFGVLFGLYDWRFEVLGLVSHSLHFQQRYGVGPHTLSFPRLRPAQGVRHDPAHLVSDEQFKRVIAALRLSVPYTGLILTAREPASLRKEVMQFGVSQIDAGSRVEIGGYAEKNADEGHEDISRSQFELGDIRPLDMVIQELLLDGFIPSFCTSCYRLGRTGEHFMEYAIPGFIERFCTPNALTTLTEYLKDYASDATRDAGRRLVAAELAKLPAGKLKDELVRRLTVIETSDSRDLYF